MTPGAETSAGQPHDSAALDEPAEDATGLPWPRTWPGVYLLVIGSFVLWVVLLVVLEWAFS